MIDRLANLRQDALDALGAVSSPAELEDWRITYLGRKGPLTEILRGLGQAPPEERREVGAAANRLKQELESAREAQEAALREEAADALTSRDAIDVTLPGRPALRGHLHPTTLMIREITGAFAAMGFQVVEGPEVEWDRYNFEALNIPPTTPRASSTIPSGSTRGTTPARGPCSCGHTPRRCRSASWRTTGRRCA